MSIDERVAHVEGRVDGQAQMVTDIGARLVGLDNKFDLRFSALEARFEARFAALEAKFVALETKFDRRFAAFEEKTGRRFDALEFKMSSNFRWMVGIQFTILVALLASFIAG